MNTVSKVKKELTVNSYKIVFPRNIEQILDFGDIVVVLLIPERDDMVLNDLYGVRDGEIIWRVQDVREYDPFYHTPLTKIDYYKEDREIVIANDCEGFRFLINPNNGRIIGTESWVK